MSSQKIMAGLVVLQNQNGSQTGSRRIHELLREDLEHLCMSFGQDISICQTWQLNSIESVHQYQAELNLCDPELVILIFQSQEVFDLLSMFIKATGDRPIVDWGFLPWHRHPHPLSYSDMMRGIGASAMISSLGVFKDLGKPFFAAFGSPDDPQIRKDLTTIGHAAQVLRYIRNARFGIITPHYNQGNILNPGYYSKRPGMESPPLKISADILIAETKNIQYEQIKQFQAIFSKTFPIVQLSEATLHNSIRLSLALQNLAEQLNLDLLGIDNDPQRLIHSGIECRPCLWPQSEGENRTIFQPSSDLDSGLANFILHKLAPDETFFLTIWLWDRAKNLIIGGHSGLQQTSLAEPNSIVLGIDHEWDTFKPGASAQFEFMVKPGRVTLLQIRRAANGLQAIATCGMCLESDIWVQGMPQAVIRLDYTLDRFLEQMVHIGCGSTWVLAYSSVIPELQALCSMLNIPLEILRN